MAGRADRRSARRAVEGAARAASVGAAWSELERETENVAAAAQVSGDPVARRVRKEAVERREKRNRILVEEVVHRRIQVERAAPDIETIARRRIDEDLGFDFVVEHS